jgi:hypothetical protein
MRQQSSDCAIVCRRDVIIVKVRQINLSALSIDENNQTPTIAAVAIAALVAPRNADEFVERHCLVRAPFLADRFLAVSL